MNTTAQEPPSTDPSPQPSELLPLTTKALRRAFASAGPFTFGEHGIVLPGDDDTSPV